MEKSNVLKSYLIISGLLLTLIGASTLIIPAEMKSTAGIFISDNINILNDVRGMSALLLVVALVALTGVFNQKITYTSSLITPLLFLSIGLGRVLSILLDGMPEASLLKATGLELVLGTIGIILFQKFKLKLSK
ncbi:DUF4345 domain-containing protein [Flammeovirga sp. MY04]|uniref:DUF4345 domain-containing protein n=1 Tax=Flammeovirga sp. MY04 TaxID=1191459 RepID=UPI000806398C|nr:DUF4345 domain-containing protein [Flammeovirga sp. MY04]ANQ52355.1 DUF4345 domain-containing protein [Flammeovirga sp. MY04]